MRAFASGRTSVALGISTMALALALATPVQAQTTSGIRGHIDGAQAGSTVVITDANTGQMLTTKVDARGNYQLLGLRPSTYHVVSGGKAQDVTIPLLKR